METLSTFPTSKRGYLSQAELAQYADITIDDVDEADDKINQAEEMIDAFVGFADRFFPRELVGKMSQVSSSTVFKLESNLAELYEINYFAFCDVEIISGTGAGQRRRIASSLKDGTLTIARAWVTNPDTTSFYRINQIGKFPRREDARYYTES